MFPDYWTIRLPEYRRSRKSKQNQSNFQSLCGESTTNSEIRQTELYKLHLKHHHMSLSQFKKRTSALQIPKDVYEAYGEVVKKCETCQTVKSAPSRARASGLRSDTFGDLTFVDHGEITLPRGLEKLMFIIFYDGATNLVTARAVETQNTDSIMSQMTEYFEVYQLTPKVVVGDQQFMSVNLKHIVLVMGSSL